MPRTYRYRRRRYRRKKKGCSTKKCIRKVVTDIIKKSEPAHYYAAVANGQSVDSSSPLFVNLTSPIAQATSSDSVTTRSGDVIEPTSVQFNTWICRNSTSTTSTTYARVRLTLFQWTADTAADTPNVADLFHSPSYLSISPFNQNAVNKRNFKILYDTSFTLGPSFTSTSAPGSHLDGTRTIKVFIPKKKLRSIEFQPGTSTGRNHIYAMLWGSEANGDDDCLAHYSYVVRFNP